MDILLAWVILHWMTMMMTTTKLVLMMKMTNYLRNQSLRSCQYSEQLAQKEGRVVVVEEEEEEEEGEEVASSQGFFFFVLALLLRCENEIKIKENEDKNDLIRM